MIRTIESNRFVTGVSWVDGALWHATWGEDGSDLRRINPGTGEVLDVRAMPKRTGISGLEFDGAERFFCGGGKSGKMLPSGGANGGPDRCDRLGSIKVVDVRLRHRPQLLLLARSRLWLERAPTLIGHSD